MDALREIVLPRLEMVRKNGAGFSARCPAHEDTTPSLSVSAGQTQPVVFSCHAGCDPELVLDALTLTWADLCAPREEPTGEWTPHGEAIAVYDYLDEHGTLLFQVLRTADKKFAQRIPDATAKHGYRWRLGDTRRVLYRLPKIRDAITDGRVIWVVEGEKDVHTLERHGLPATCNPGGAGKWRPDYAEVLRDADVIIVADADQPGQAHARQVAASLDGVAASVEIREPVTGKDISDHLAVGYKPYQLVTTWPSAQPTMVDLAPDLHEFLGTVDPPYDWIIDGLLERGDRLMLTGFEGLGKSMLSRQIAVCVACGMHPFTGETIPRSTVLFIDCENSERHSRRKFRPLGRTATVQGHPIPEGGLRLIHRPQGIDLTRDDAAWLMERVTAHRPDLLIIGPLYRLHAADTNEELAARATVQALDAARTTVDCALIVEAHAGHGDASRTRSVRPVGSSLFLRWPEFGYGLAPATEDDPPTLVDVRAWRGPRDERRWPRQLTRGHDHEWPWKAASSHS